MLITINNCYCTGRYRKIAGDKCVKGGETFYLPLVQTCPLQAPGDINLFVTDDSYTVLVGETVHFQFTQGQVSGRVTTPPSLVSSLVLSVVGSSPSLPSPPPLSLPLPSPPPPLPSPLSLGCCPLNRIPMVLRGQFHCHFQWIKQRLSN